MSLLRITVWNISVWEHFSLFTLPIRRWESRYLFSLERYYKCFYNSVCSHGDATSYSESNPIFHLQCLKLFAILRLNFTSFSFKKNISSEKFLFLQAWKWKSLLIPGGGAGEKDRMNRGWVRVKNWGPCFLLWGKRQSSGESWKSKFAAHLGRYRGKFWALYPIWFENEKAGQ